MKCTWPEFSYIFFFTSCNVGGSRIFIKEGSTRDEFWSPSTTKSTFNLMFRRFKIYIYTSKKMSYIYRVFFLQGGFIWTLLTQCGPAPGVEADSCRLWPSKTLGRQTQNRIELSGLIGLNFLWVGQGVLYAYLTDRADIKSNQFSSKPNQTNLCNGWTPPFNLDSELTELNFPWTGQVALCLSNEPGLPKIGSNQLPPGPG